MHSERRRDRLSRLRTKRILYHLKNEEIAVRCRIAGRAFYQFASVQ